LISVCFANLKKLLDNKIVSWHKSKSY